jgi:serine/threonine protein phosphatase PrpC
VTYVAVTALSHTGLVRDHNEDSLAVGPWTLCGTVTENPQTLVFQVGTPLVVAVADGLGGHPGGEVASALVVRRIAGAGPTMDSEDAVRDVLRACNKAVYAAADRNPELITMGTTIAGIVVGESAVIPFNVGDSRVYRIGPDRLRLISVDDNPPLAPGERSSAIVTQTLGGHSAFVDIDPHVSREPISADASYLVCSDGLSDLVSDEVIAEILREHQDGRAAYQLWRAAIDAGGLDNVTIAIVRIVEMAAETAAEPSDSVTASPDAASGS